MNVPVKPSLLKEITEEEIDSLDCSNLKKQKANWDLVLKEINIENLTNLLQSLNMRLASFRAFKESKGIINAIYLVEAVKLDEKREVKREYILKVNNPDTKWNGAKTNEAAIINYLKANTNIPVPNIISYSYDPSTSLLKCSYILMEKAPGYIFKQLLPHRAADIPEVVIDQIIGFAKTLRSIKPLSDSVKIGALDENMNLLPIYPLKKVYNSYLDFWNDNMIYAIGELNKMNKYKELASELDVKRKQVVEKVSKKPEANNLNYDDYVSIIHADLNPTNILIDPKTHEITCLIDWEWAYLGFDQLTGFYEAWFNDDDYTERENLEKIFTEKLKSQHSDWYKFQKGQRIRQYLNHVYYLAMFTHNYYVFEFKPYQIKPMEYQLRQWINSFAELLKEKLKYFDRYLEEI